MVKCANCGSEVGESIFCPNCGSKMPKPEPVCEETNTKNYCPNCGSEVGDSNFCPDCGSKIVKSEIATTTNNNSSHREKDIYDNIINIDEKISGKLGGLFKKNKTLNKVLDKTTSFQSFRYKLYQNRENLENTEPVFIEVYDSIDDSFIKDLLMLERSAMATTSSVVGIAASHFFIPTKNMSHDEAVMFYQDIVNKIVSEVNQEKQKGNFDEETYYNNKVKELSINNMSILGISKSMKSYNENRK